MFPVLELPDVAWSVSLCSVLLIASVHVASAEEARFRVEGERLFYNSNIPYPDDRSTDINMNDADELGLYLMEAPEISTVVLESGGGLTAAAIAMGEKIAKLGLATEVRNSCESACPLIFLGGRPRTLLAGGVLGFHRSHVSASSIKHNVEYRRSKKGVTINSSEEAYDDAISSAVNVLQYMVRRGVKPEFLLAMLAVPPREMWRPSRTELVEAGIIDAD